MSDRTILSVTGNDRTAFLQDLVTNDLDELEMGLVYAALLSAQGKYLSDFLLVPAPDAILIDVEADAAEALARRLTMYRLRRDVAIAAADLNVALGTGPAPEGAYPDPRHEALPWRLYGSEAVGAVPDALRVEHVIPETGIELIPDETYILEAGFERLNGVDFRKGCYVGQEVTARMKHKTELRKGLTKVAIDGAAPTGTVIETADGRPAGTLYTQAGGHALAHLRFDRANGPLIAGAARIDATR